MKRALVGLLPTVWALLLAALVTSTLCLFISVPPLEVYRRLFLGTWGNGYGVGQVLFKATPLLFTGLSVSLALEAGLFNVGAEGQIVMGAFCAALVGSLLPTSTPAPFAVLLSSAAAFGGGALVGLVPGVLKARGAHEVLTTILINFIVRAMMVGLGRHFFERETVHTRAIIDSAHLPRLSEHFAMLSGSAANWSLFLGLACLGAVSFFLRQSRPGFELRAVGASPLAAETVGLSVSGVYIGALAVAGGLAGLGGINFVLGSKGYYEDGFSGGVGFVGIAVAVLGGGRPLGILMAALFLGTLSQGALAVNALCPKELIDVLQAVVILAVAVTSPLVDRLWSQAVAAEKAKGL